MSIFSATFSAVAATLAQDVFEVVAPADSWVALRELRLGQYTDFGDAAAEILSIQIIRGYTVSGSGGSSVTPISRSPATASLASTVTVEANNTTVANTGTAQVLLSDVWNVQTPYLYLPDKDTAIMIRGSQRLVVRITAPADSITLNGTIVFEQTGLGAA